ncbi:hypothetical protein ABIB40_000660 [Pedobacter sp. UYP30]
MLSYLITPYEFQHKNLPKGVYKKIWKFRVKFLRMWCSKLQRISEFLSEYKS